MSAEPTKFRFFDSHDVAKIYAEARPYFHPTVMDRVRVLAGIEGSLGNGLDIGCGTGLSTRALRLLADRVLGTDISQGMVDNAERIPGVEYKLGPAEHQPVEDASQDIVTISSAFHWVDPGAFFSEVRRILRPNGLLVVYENGFTGQMRGDQNFAAWVEESYIQRFPTPPRKPKFSFESAPTAFEKVADEHYENEVVFTKPQIIEYFLTQSNIIAKVESGETTYDQARRWLSKEVLFGGAATFVFAGSIHLVRKSKF